MILLAEVDWTQIIINFILSLPGTIGAVIAAFIAYKSIDKVAEVKLHVERVQMATDGMKDELIEEVRKAATLQGEKSGAEGEIVKQAAAQVTRDLVTQAALTATAIAAPSQTTPTPTAPPITPATPPLPVVDSE